MLHVHTERGRGSGREWTYRMLTGFSYPAVSNTVFDGGAW